MAQVTTRGSNLQVYAEPSASGQIIGSLANGDYINVLSTRTVLSTEWVRFTSPNFVNGWAIMKSPAVNYSYIDPSADAPAVMSISGYAASNQTAVEVKNVEDSTDTSKRTSGGITSSNTVKVYTPDGTKVGSVFTAKTTLPTLDDGIRISGGSGDPSKNPPGIVQNDKGYPVVKGTYNGRYMYDYATDYSNSNLMKAMDLVRDSINLSLSNPKTLFSWSSENYNRFKVVNPNELLTKAFPHVFFIRPDCDLLSGANSNTLGYNVKNVPLYASYFKNCPQVVYSLVKNCTSSHNFMMLLSNHAESMELRDRSLETDTYGKSVRGNGIAYGRHMEKSVGPGEFSIQYTDDYDLHVMKTHELWLDYIENMKTGRYTPAENKVIDKVIDYATAVYYVLCGADGETVIYIAKYTGVFPTNIPDSALSYSKGNLIQIPNYSITYQYSWIEPNTPEVITDFNGMSSPSNFTAEAAYQPDILSTGTTWVGAPFIQSEKQLDGTTQYKLRFKHIEKRGR